MWFSIMCLGMDCGLPTEWVTRSACTVDVQAARQFDTDDEARRAVHEEHCAWIADNEAKGNEGDEFSLLPDLPPDVALWTDIAEGTWVGPARDIPFGATSPGTVIGVTLWSGEGRSHTTAAQLIVRLPTSRK